MGIIRSCEREILRRKYGNKGLSKLYADIKQSKSKVKKRKSFNLFQKLFGFRK